MESGKINTYKDLIVWQRAMELVVAVYEFTELLPKSELYGLSSQMRRASLSIPSNIAEGRRRSTRKDFYHFLIISYSSGAELETHIEITKRLSFSKGLSFERIDKLLDEVMRMLNTMVNHPIS